MLLNKQVVETILVDCASVKVNQYNMTNNPASKKSLEADIETVLWVATRMGFTSTKEVYEGRISKIIIGGSENEFENQEGNNH